MPLKKRATTKTANSTANGEEVTKSPAVKRKTSKSKNVKETTPELSENDQSANEDNGEEVIESPALKKKASRAKKDKEPIPESPENDQSGNEESSGELAKSSQKKASKKSNIKKPKTSKKIEKSSDNESSTEENNVAAKKPHKKAIKGESQKSKAKNKKESSDENVEENKAESKNKTSKIVQGTKKRTRDDDSEDEPKEKKTKTDKKKPMNPTESNLEEVNVECDKVNEDGEKYNLKITCWNVSGIRSVIKKNGLDYLKKEDADIIVLQEIKCENPKLPSEVELSGYERYFLDSEKSGYCGVALYSKVKPIKVKYGIKNSKCNNEGRIITAEYEKFYLVNTYVPNAGKKLITMPKRLEWNEDFKEYIKELDAKKPVIICGDMNVAHQEIDLKNPKTNTKNAGFTKEERDGMTDFLAQGFVDTFRKLYPDKTDAYTFWSYMSNARAKNVGWRLDYYLVSERISKQVCDNVIQNKVYGSDHCPIVLYIKI